MTTDLASDSAIRALEEMALMAQQGPDYRANVPGGTVLGSERIEGSDSRVNYTKSRSMIRSGDTALPERVMLWNLRTGQGRPVPSTVAMKRITQGTKQFPPEAFTLRDPGLPEREPIEEHCWVCDADRAKRGEPPRNFFDIIQYEAHMQILHPRQWDSHLRREASAERLEDRQAMRDMILEVVKAMRPGAAVTEEDEEAVAAEVVRRVSRKGAG